MHSRTWRREKRVHSDRSAIALFRRLIEEKEERSSEDDSK